MTATAVRGMMELQFRPVGSKKLVCKTVITLCPQANVNMTETAVRGSCMMEIAYCSLDL
jgi:hypothetical protein